MSYRRGEIPATGDHEEYELPEGFTGETQIQPGYDKRAGGFGLDMVHIVILVHGPKATMVFDVTTGITPVLVPGKFGGSQEWMQHPHILSKVEFHGDVEAFEGHEKWGGWSERCSVRPAGRCLLDTGYTMGEPLEEILFKRGERAVMRELVAIYRKTYENGEP